MIIGSICSCSCKIYIFETNIHSCFKGKQKQRTEAEKQIYNFQKKITLDRIVFLKHVRTSLVFCSLIITIEIVTSMRENT